MENRGQKLEEQVATTQEKSSLIADTVTSTSCSMIFKNPADTDSSDTNTNSTNINVQQGASIHVVSTSGSAFGGSAVTTPDSQTSNDSVPKITEPEATASDIEKKEEAKLRAKYPPRQLSGQSAFLHRRLQKGQKFFDSGDYQMAQQGKGKISKMPPLLAQKPTGEAIPTPDTVPARKTSIIYNKLPTSTSTQLT